jgi:hypothetical protein
MILEIVDGKVAAIQAVVNPQKLRRVTPPRSHTDVATR